MISCMVFWKRRAISHSESPGWTVYEPVPIGHEDMGFTAFPINMMLPLHDMIGFQKCSLFRLLAHSA